MMGEDTRDGFVDLREPDRSSAIDLLDSKVQPSVAGEQRPDAQRYGQVCGVLVGHGRTS